MSSDGPISRNDESRAPPFDVLRRALELGRSKRECSTDSLKQFRYVGSSLSPVIAGQYSLMGFNRRTRGP